jgi:hypothetical protein
LELTSQAFYIDRSLNHESLVITRSRVRCHVL